MTTTAELRRRREDDLAPRVLTIVGQLPVRPPAARVATLPLLPASDDELGDLVHNCLQHATDRLDLSHSDEHMVAILERSQRIEDDRDRLESDRDRGRELLRRAYEEIQALRAALVAEREAVAQLSARIDGEIEHAEKMQQQCAALASAADAARRGELRSNEARAALAAQLADALAELGEQDGQIKLLSGELDLIRAFESASRGRIPPALETFEPGRTLRWPHGTRPDNETVDAETVVVDVGGAR